MSTLLAAGAAEVLCYKCRRVAAKYIERGVAVVEGGGGISITAKFHKDLCSAHAVVGSVCTEKRGRQPKQRQVSFCTFHGTLWRFDTVREQ